MREWTEMIFRGMRILFEIGLHGEFCDIVMISGGRRLFLEVLYRSMIVGGIVLVILLLRVLLRRMPRLYSYGLWILVLYRLLCPFTLVSSCSFLEIFDKAAFDMGQDVYAGIRLSGNWRTALWAAAHVWTAGIILMLLYGIVHLLYFSRRLKGTVRVRDNIYLSDYIPTSFVMGIIWPRIYLPSDLEKSEWDYVILHEKMHIRRGDHIIRILSFVTLAVYWFHPLIWAAFYLSGKDMEMACDEAVMQRTDRDIRADYSASLLKLSTGRWFTGGIPLAFGEKDVKKRIENVMRWRKPRPAAVGVALAMFVAAVVILGTDPVSAGAEAQTQRQELQQFHL